MTIPIGERAPGFDLPAAEGGSRSLDEGEAAEREDAGRRALVTFLLERRAARHGVEALPPNEAGLAEATLP